VTKTIWCERYWFPYHYGFCPNEAAWKREMKRMGCPHVGYPTQDAACTHMESKATKNQCTLVTVAHVKRPAIVVISLLVHEAMHVWRAIREDIGETYPSSEFEAYSLQNISQNLIAAYEKTRGRLCR
jgi:hypothetical protein